MVLKLSFLVLLQNVTASLLFSHQHFLCNILALGRSETADAPVVNAQGCVCHQINIKPHQVVRGRKGALPLPRQTQSLEASCLLTMRGWDVRGTAGIL